MNENTTITGTPPKPAAAKIEPKHIKVDPALIARSLTNPRGPDFTAAEDWPEFVASIRQHGVKQWPLVRELPAARTDAAAKGRKYELVAGERRVTAALAAKLPAINVVLEELSDAQVVEIQQIENLQRADLSALEEAQGYAAWRDSLLKAGVVKTVQAAVEYIGQKISRKPTAVYGKLALLKTAPAVQAALKTGKIDASKAGLIATIPDPALQAKVLKEATSPNWQNEVMSVRGLADHIQRNYQKNLGEAVFDTKAAPVNAGQYPGMVNLACQDCSHRNGTKCASPACYALKTRAHGEAKLAEAKAAGRAVMSAEVYEREEHKLALPERTCWEDNKNRKWSALAKKAGVTPTLAIDDAGKPVDVFTPVQVEQIKKANKIKANATSSPDNKRAKTKKANGEIAKLATAGILRALVTDAGIDNRLWRLLADAVAGQVGIDRESFVAKRRGLAKVQGEVRDGLEAWLSRKDITTRELQEFIVEALLCSSWGDWNGNIDQEFKELCALAKVDVEKLKTAPPETTASTNMNDRRTAMSGGHDWQKTDLVSGVNTNYKCKNCGGVGVRYGFQWPPVGKGVPAPCPGPTATVTVTKVAGEKKTTTVLKMSPAAKAKIAASAKARWAKVKAAKKN